MTSERTLPPSARRLLQARRSGDVAISPMLTGAAALLGAGMAVWQLGGRLVGEAASSLHLLASVNARADLTTTAVLAVLGSAVAPVAFSLGTVLFGGAIAALAAGLAQTRFAFSPIELKPNRLDPANGIGRLAKGLFNERTAVMLLAAAACCAVLWSSVQSAAGLTAGPITDLGALTDVTTAAIAELAIRLSGVALIAGLLDRLLVTWQRDKRLRMTADERRREDREESVNPYIRARLRKIAAKRGASDSEAAR